MNSSSVMSSFVDDRGFSAKLVEEKGESSKLSFWGIDFLLGLFSGGCGVSSSLELSVALFAISSFCRLLLILDELWVSSPSSLFSVYSAVGLIISGSSDEVFMKYLSDDGYSIVPEGVGENSEYEESLGENGACWSVF